MNPLLRHCPLVALLLLPLSFCPAQPAATDIIPLPPANYAQNGGFEHGLDAWEFFAGRSLGRIVEETPHSGKSCLQVSGTNTDYRYLNQTPILLEPGRTYTLSAWIKCRGFKRAGDNAQVVNLINYGWTKSAQVGPRQPDEDWTRYSVTFEAFPTSEAGGRPSYTLTVFWPIGSEGTVWIDDVQIEEGTQATDFIDRYLGWAIEARAGLRRLRTRAEAVQRSIAAGFEGKPASAALQAKAAEVLRDTDELAAKLRRFAELPYDEAASLADDVAVASDLITALGQAYFCADPYLPLSELSLPEDLGRDPRVQWRCLQGEQRAVALTVANVSTEAATARVVPGELYDLTRRVPVRGLSWVQAYNVPRLRGHLKPWEQYTDPLVQLDEAGLWPQPAGRLSQIVLVCDTDKLRPGSYQGAVTLTCLSAEAPQRELRFNIEVVPLRLPEPGVVVCDIGMMADYAEDCIAPLRVNTFTVSSQWLVPERGAKGEVTVDFTRVATLVRSRLQRCPGGSFWIGFGGSEAAVKHLGKLYGLPADDPKLDPLLADWTHAVVRGFGRLGVGPERLIIETVDEPGEGELARAAHQAAVIRQAEPRVRTQSYVTSFQPDSAPHRQLYSALDITSPAFTSINPQTVAELRKLGKQIWVYDCQNSGETFHPVTYNRLLPWLAFRYGLDGWGHFSMLDSARGRNYEPWEGVAQESQVYPAAGEGGVISRRLLALQAGTEDYCVLTQLARMAASAKRAGREPQAVAEAERLLAEAPAKALELARPGREYFTGLRPGASAECLDQTRETAVSLAAQLAPPPAPLQAKLLPAAGPTPARLQLDLSGAAALRVSYLVDHRPGWQEASASGSGRMTVSLPAAGPVTRCLVTSTDAEGVVSTALLPEVPAVTVDATLEPYRSDCLNDGLAMPGMKFEPEWGWIAGGPGEHWVELRLPRAAPVRGLRVWWMTFYGLPQAVKAQVWSGGAWHDAPGYEQWRPAKTAVEELTFPPVTTDRVRLLQKAGGGNVAFPTLMGASEVEAM